MQSSINSAVGTGGENIRGTYGNYIGLGSTQYGDWHDIQLGFRPTFLIVGRGYDRGDYNASYALFVGTPTQIGDSFGKIIRVTDNGFSVKQSVYNTSTYPQLWLDTQGVTYSYFATA